MMDLEKRERESKHRSGKTYLIESMHEGERERESIKQSS